MDGDLRPEEPERIPSRWRSRPKPRPSSFRYLLDLDVDLAEALDVRMRMVARPSVTAITFEGDAGELRLGRWLSAAAGGPGVLVLEGVIAINVRVGDRIAAELVGTGDVIQPWQGEDEELLACDIGWRALLPARLALLDSEFTQRVKPWPQVSDVLLRRAGRRTRRLNVQRAIAAQPRLEVRLALLLWHLAARWGKVEPGGIRLGVPLTHQLLGRLVAAERPSVSHALHRLTQAGVISGHGDEWHLYGTLKEQLATMTEPESDRVAQLVSAAAKQR